MLVQIAVAALIFFLLVTQVSPLKGHEFYKECKRIFRKLKAQKVMYKMKESYYIGESPTTIEFDEFAFFDGFGFSIGKNYIFKWDCISLVNLFWYCRIKKEVMRKEIKVLF